MISSSTKARAFGLATMLATAMAVAAPAVAQTGASPTTQPGPAARPGKAAPARSVRKPVDPQAARARHEQAFARFDGNHDGFVDRAEIDKALTAIGDRRAKAGKPVKTSLNDRAARMLARYDTNNDGKISKDEFMNSAGAKGRQRRASKNAA